MKSIILILLVLTVGCSREKVKFSAPEVIIVPDTPVVVPPIPEPPAPPAPLPVTSNNAKLMWDKNTEPDLAGYIVYRSDTSNVFVKGANSVNVGLNNTYEFTNLKRGMTHYFAVTAYDFSGNESTPSVQVSKFIELR